METIIFHIDVNSAFLSWSALELLKNGREQVDIRTIPSIIGGDQKSRHGVVLAKSVPAKSYGIQTGEPVAKAMKKCPGLRMESPEHRKYREYSHRLMDFLRQYTAPIEQLSIDECFMDFTEIQGKYASSVDGAVEIKDAIKEKFGFTVNVGVSNNKLLAKMASDFEKPDRVHTLFPEEIKEKMWPLPVSNLYMAGRASVETLRKLDIRTIGELAQSDPALLQLHLKSYGEMLWRFANGQGDTRIQSARRKAKGVGNSITLAEDVDKSEEAKEALKKLAESVGKRLRESGMKAGMVSVEIRYATFQNVSHQCQLLHSSNKDYVIYQTACQLFDELWTGKPLRLLGIRTSKLAEESEPEQLTLFFE